MNGSIVGRTRVAGGGNRIADLHSESWDTPEGPRHALMVAIDIEDGATAASFVDGLVPKVLNQRMISHPDTSMMLVTIIGELTAERFSELWTRALDGNPAMAAFMSLMTVADVIHGTRDGTVLDRDSLVRTHRADRRD